jgi:DNA repair protein RadA/Sms
VLEKRAGIRVSSTNVFVNIAGGIRITEPAADLAVCAAIASSLTEKVIENQTIIIGEVGLGGEIRSVGHIEKRIQEAEKLGFKNAIIPSSNKKELKSSGSISLKTFENLDQVVKSILTKSSNS